MKKSRRPLPDSFLRSRREQLHAESRVETKLIERLLQSFCLHYVGVHDGATIDWIDTAPDAILIDM